MGRDAHLLNVSQSRVLRGTRRFLKLHPNERQAELPQHDFRRSLPGREAFLRSTEQSDGSEFHQQSRVVRDAVVVDQRRRDGGPAGPEHARDAFALRAITRSSDAALLSSLKPWLRYSWIDPELRALFAANAVVTQLTGRTVIGTFDSSHRQLAFLERLTE